MKRVGSIKELRKICQEGVWEDEHWRGKIERKLSIYLTKFFLYTPLTANQITLIMLLIGVGSAFFFLKGEYIYSLIGILLFQFHHILDCSDGEVARCKKTISLKGVYLDSMSHVIIPPLLIMAIAIGVFFNNPLPIPNESFLIIGFIGMFSLIMINFVDTKKYETYIKSGNFAILKKTKKVDNQLIKNTFKNKIKREAKFLMSFKVLNLMFFLVILNLIVYFLLIYVVVSFSFFMIKFYKVYMSFK